MPFREIRGHDALKSFLSRALGRDRVPPAVLFAGPEGVGKKALALAASRALVCLGRRDDPCDECASCDRARRGIHPDVVLVAPPSKTAIKIDQVRDLAREVGSRPFESRNRGFVIDDAHLMTEEASNALLKSLEEPPDTSHVFLVTATPQGLLPTIRSRCQVLRAGPLPADVVQAHLRDVAGMSAEEARLRARLCGGSIGAALAFESDVYRAVREDTIRLLEATERGAALETLDLSQRLADAEDLPLALTTLRSLLRDLQALRLGVPEASLLNADVADRLRGLAKGSVGARARALAEAVTTTRTAVRGNANKLLAVDSLADALGAR
jgi:DNA polymerase-3 subunit delta'